MPSKGMVDAPWEKLRFDISGLIFERLDLEDRIRFNLVCKQWGKNTKQIPQPLWLMLPYELDDEYLSFFDMYDAKVRKLNLPKSVRGGWFFGSSSGWLFLALGTTSGNLRILLFDPISRAQIRLPPLSTISNIEDWFYANRCSEWNPCACTIGSIEPSSSQCIVAITFCDLEYNTSLALCRPGDERWTMVEGLLAEGYSYGNIIFFGGELYATVLSLDLENNNNQAPFQTHCITIGSQRVKLKVIYSTPPPSCLFNDEDVDAKLLYLTDCNRWPCLVESDGQLLMITQIWDAICTWDGDGNGEGEEREDGNGEGEGEEEGEVEEWGVESRLTYFEAATFEILKIETSEDTMCATSLSDLGNPNQSLFLGIGDCLALENPNKFDKNCIYFLQLYSYLMNRMVEKPYPSVCREAGVYHLDDGSITRCFPSVKTQSTSFMHWFLPNI